MRKERIIICGNPDCQAEKRVAKPDEVEGKLSQAYCEHCGHVSLPKIKE
ncbi:MAG TPA: hypothetical protein VJ907_05925 [Halanaerobiales bacterium]|nr:hypothetical protein [Halanaerobiales bacterium]